MEQLTLLIKNIQQLESVLVAFSGGVDSTLLLAAAKQALGNKVLAVTITSDIIPEKENKTAEETAHFLGVKHLLLPVLALHNQDFANNTPLRCYHCKKLCFSQLKQLAAQQGLCHVIEGSNQDDLTDYRPGRQAALELGIKSPLQKVGLTKKNIRTLAKALALPAWNKPAQPCLATRIPYGTPITHEALVQIKEAEQYLNKLFQDSWEKVFSHGNRLPTINQKYFQLRVRHHGNLARLEIPPEFFPLITKPDIAKTIYHKLKTLGYAYITIDLLGYRQGSMNEMLD
jgi:uncharacterized protein